MKALLWLAVFAGVSAGIAQAGALDITLHDTNDTDVNLSTILGIWGTPGTNGTSFFIPGTGSDEFGALNLVDDVGTINSIQIYAYGTVAGSSMNPSCTDGSGYSTWTCSVSGPSGAKNTTISINDPVVWSFNDAPVDPISLGTEFRIVDTSGAATGAVLYWQIDINGTGPVTATPEPATVIPMGAGLLGMGLLVYRRRKAAATN
jgi:hypothetical protein